MLGLRWWLGWWLDMGENPPCFFYVFFLFGWCFFVGGKEKKRMETKLFWEEEPTTFLVFLCFFGPF